jgi:hypothetical protein
MFEVCSTATPVGSQFLPTARAGRKRQHPQHVDACLTPGKAAAWTAASLGARKRPDTATAFTLPSYEEKAPGLALLSAPMPFGRSRFKTPHEAPFVRPDELHIVLYRNVVNTISREIPSHQRPR